MRAAYLTQHGGPESLVLGELPRPTPGKGELLVRVQATAVTPTEFDWSPTFKTPNGDPRPFPIVLSHEFSGTVAEVGEGVTGLIVGDSVYGINDWYKDGALAEFCVAPAGSVSIKPEALDHTTAAVVPISALTAWQGLFDRANLKAGERVLIHGASGAVGVFAVQLARWRGAHILATASNRNLDFVARLGADEVIDYKSTPFEKVARNVDVVFDSVGGETLDRSWRLLSPGGRLVTIASQSEPAKEQRTRDAFFIVEPSQTQLTRISQLLQEGTLRAFVEKVFDLSSVREAYARARHGGMQGKVAIGLN